MWYLIHGIDHPNSLEGRKAPRGRRTWRGSRRCATPARLKLAGPLPAIDAEDPGPAGFTGSIIVAEFGSLAEARAWADEDPYLAAGVYARVDVSPFRLVLP